MSKKKKLRKMVDSMGDFLEESTHQAQESALAFLQTATPFQVSLELSNRGASTVNQDQIFQVLDRLVEGSAASSSAALSVSEEQGPRVLLDQWEDEAIKKGREPDLDDLVFFEVVAGYYAFRWEQARIGTKRQPEAFA